jgi:hypothetical protein
MPQSLAESTLFLHNLANDFKDHEAGLPELHRVETWITSHTSTRSAAGLKGWASVTGMRTRSRATSVSSASSIAVTLATVCTNAGSSGGLEEQDGKSEQPSRDRDILGKRARQTAEVRGQTLVHLSY